MVSSLDTTASAANELLVAQEPQIHERHLSEVEHCIGRALSRLMAARVVVYISAVDFDDWRNGRTPRLLLDIRASPDSAANVPRE